MIQSMTGYGKALFENEKENITVEIRTLNSKQTDINMRIPHQFKPKELEIRTLLNQKLVRGKIDFVLNYVSQEPSDAPEVNRQMVEHYYRQLKEIESVTGMSTGSDYLSIIAKMPDIFVSKEAEPDETTWQNALKTIEEAADKVIRFRMEEGKILERDFKERIHAIMGLLEKVDPLEKNRIIKIRERIKKHLAEYLGETDANPERLEQEIIYYIEKLDITEEKVRLKKHCEYFLKVMDGEKNAGKKLIFIGQEIGREINTLGSKANDAELQKTVVLMKEELEKIKEQLYNIL